MTIEELINQAAATLRAAKFESPRLEAELLLAAILDWERSEVLTRGLELVSSEAEEEFKLGLQKRLRGEPLAYIVGYRDFFRHQFVVKEGVLIPRPESEMLVEYAEKWLRTQGIAITPMIVDLGCGSGCLGLSLSVAVKGRLAAVDSSRIACKVTMENARRLGVETETGIIQSSVQNLDVKGLLNRFQAIGVDVVLANPPYIAENDPNVCPNVKRFEPSQALFAGDDGLVQIREWLPVITQLLRAGGLLCMEHGAGQSKEVSKLIEQQGAFGEIESHRDLAGWDRMVTAKKLSH